jgi:hypothetical protein
MRMYMDQREALLREMRELAEVCPNVESTDCYKAAMDMLEVPEITFTRTWNYDNEMGEGTSYVFETSKSLDTREVTDGNQDETSDFRLDIGKDGTAVVYTIGDSNDGGFLICEEATYMFDMLWLMNLIGTTQPQDVQSEYDEWKA